MRMHHTLFTLTLLLLSLSSANVLAQRGGFRGGRGRGSNRGLNRGGGFGRGGHGGGFGGGFGGPFGGGFGGGGNGHGGGNNNSGGNNNGNNGGNNNGNNGGSNNGNNGGSNNGNNGGSNNGNNGGSNNGGNNGSNNGGGDGNNNGSSGGAPSNNNGQNNQADNSDNDNDNSNPPASKTTKATQIESSTTSRGLQGGLETTPATQTADTTFATDPASPTDSDTPTVIGTASTKSRTGAIVGGIIAGIFVFIIIPFYFFYTRRTKSPRAHSRAPSRALSEMAQRPGTISPAAQHMLYGTATPPPFSLSSPAPAAGGVRTGADAGYGTIYPDALAAMATMRMTSTPSWISDDSLESESPSTAAQTIATVTSGGIAGADNYHQGPVTPSQAHIPRNSADSYDPYDGVVNPFSNVNSSQNPFANPADPIVVPPSPNSAVGIPNPFTNPAYDYEYERDLPNVPVSVHGHDDLDVDMNFPPATSSVGHSELLHELEANADAARSFTPPSPLPVPPSAYRNRHDSA